MNLRLPVYNPVAKTARPKPSKLDRQVRKHAGTVQRRKAKAVEDRAEQKRLNAIRADVFERDQYRSRASGTPVKWLHENPAIVGHAHHIVFASLGGSDQLFNRVLLTPAEHEMAHARGSKFVLDIHGDANKTLRFVQRNLETGAVIREWESPCPTEG